MIVQAFIERYSKHAFGCGLLRSQQVQRCTCSVPERRFLCRRRFVDERCDGGHTFESSVACGLAFQVRMAFTAPYTAGTQHGALVLFSGADG